MSSEIANNTGGEACWYVGVVNSRHEKKVATELERLGVACFVAVQQEMRQWANGKRKMVDRVVIPCVVFVRCTESERRRLVGLPYISRFMADRTRRVGELNAPPAVIPDEQMVRLMFMLGQTDYPVSFSPVVYKLRDTVRVVRGQLRGLEGQIMTAPDGTRALTISLSILGGAIVHIDPKDVEKI